MFWSTLQYNAFWDMQEVTPLQTPPPPPLDTALRLWTAQALIEHSINIWDVGPTIGHSKIKSVTGDLSVVWFVMKTGSGCAGTVTAWWRSAVTDAWWQVLSSRVCCDSPRDDPPPPPPTAEAGGEAASVDSRNKSRSKLKQQQWQIQQHLHQPLWRAAANSSNGSRCRWAVTAVCIYLKERWFSHFFINSQMALSSFVFYFSSVKPSYFKSCFCCIRDIAGMPIYMVTV